MLLVTHKRGFALNIPATRFTKGGSIVIGRQENGYNLVIAGAFADWHDEWAFAWVFPRYWKPTTYRKPA